MLGWFFVIWVIYVSIIWPHCAMHGHWSFRAGAKPGIAGGRGAALPAISESHEAVWRLFARTVTV